MARVYTKDRLIDGSDLTDVAAGDGVTGYLYGTAKLIFDWKEAAVAGGWVVTWSATRTSGTGTVANGCADSDLWSSVYKVAYEKSAIALRHAATGAAIVLQRGANPWDWRIKVATSGTYNVAGGGTGTRVPALSGEEIVIGADTDASPTFSNFLPTGSSHVFQASADSAKGDIYAFSYPVAGGATGAIGFMLSCAKLELGRSGAATQMWIASASNTPELTDLNDDTTSCAWALARKGLTSPSPTIERVQLCNVGPIPGSAAADPATGDKPMARIRIARGTSPSDHLGRCVDLLWYGPASSVPHVDDYDGGTKNRIVAGPLSMPWDGTEPL